MKKIINDQIFEIPSIAFARRCRDCNEVVLFSDAVRAINGTRVPLNKDGTRHQCGTSWEKRGVSQL